MMKGFISTLGVVSRVYYYISFASPTVYTANAVFPTPTELIIPLDSRAEMRSKSI
jgi:hypothetical protein